MVRDNVEFYTGAEHVSRLAQALSSGTSTAIKILALQLWASFKVGVVMRLGVTSPVSSTPLHKRLKDALVSFAQKRDCLFLPNMHRMWSCFVMTLA